MQSEAVSSMPTKAQRQGARPSLTPSFPSTALLPVSTPRLQLTLTIHGPSPNVTSCPAVVPTRMVAGSFNHLLLSAQPHGILQPRPYVHPFPGRLHVAAVAVEHAPCQRHQPRPRLLRSADLPAELRTLMFGLHEPQTRLEFCRPRSRRIKIREEPVFSREPEHREAS